MAPVTDRNLNKGRAGYDMRHRFVTSFSYELPVGKGRHFMNRGGFLDYIIGGYDLSWIQTVDTGNPFGFTFANSPYNYYPTNIGARVPNLVATPTMSQFGLGYDIGPSRFNQSNEYALVGASGGSPASYAGCARSDLQHLRVRCAAAVHARQCGTQHPDRTGVLLLDDLGEEELPDHGAHESAAPLRLPESVPQFRLLRAERTRWTSRIRSCSERLLPT